MSWLCALSLTSFPLSAFPFFHSFLLASLPPCLLSPVSSPTPAGYRKIKDGQTSGVVHRFSYEDVTRLHEMGGSFLGTSKHVLQNSNEIDNCLRVFEMLRVRYLVAIGGTVTAYSTSLIAAAARKNNMDFSVVHIPKTIFNDLPLPQMSRTFGFDTARETGVQIVHALKNDARSMGRWYIVVVVGQKAGHLSLGIGKAAASNLTVIPEEYQNKKVVFSEICDLVEGAIYKRKAKDKDYGVVVLTEGLVDIMDPAEMKERFGDADTGHQEIGRHVVRELRDRFKKADVEATVVDRNLGWELRAADPIAIDVDLARNLGYGATRFLLLGGTGCLVSLQDEKIKPIPLKDIVDTKTGMTQIRKVDLKGLSYEVARKYMMPLKEDDLLDKLFLGKLAKAANLSPKEFLEKFKKVAQEN